LGGSGGFTPGAEGLDLGTKRADGSVNYFVAEDSPLCLLGGNRFLEFRASIID
jgi:hypothetical protein